MNFHDLRKFMEVDCTYLTLHSKKSFKRSIVVNLYELYDRTISQKQVQVVIRTPMTNFRKKVWSCGELAVMLLLCIERFKAGSSTSKKIPFFRKIYQCSFVDANVRKCF